MTRDARQFWERTPKDAKAANRAAEDFDHIRKRLEEIRAEEEKARTA